jgi:hypothetical protein
VEVWEVKLEGDGTEPAGEYIFFYGKVNENHELGIGYFVHKRIISSVKRVECVTDRMAHIILGGHWTNTILLNVHAKTEDDVEAMRKWNVYLINSLNTT